MPSVPKTARGPNPEIATDSVPDIQEYSSALGPAQSYPSSIELFKQGAKAQEAFFIDRGLVKLTAIGESGQELIIGLRPPGRILGAASVILQKDYPVSAVTLTRCQLRRVQGDLLVNFLLRDSRFSDYLHREQSREIYEQVVQLVGLGCLSARCRLELLLNEMVSALDLNESGNEIRLQMLKQWEIAQLIAVTPQHLSRLLREMQSQGVIRREKGWIIVVEKAKLYRAPSF